MTHLRLVTPAATRQKSSRKTQRRLQPATSPLSPVNSTTSLNSSLHTLLDRLLELQPELGDMLQRRFSAMVENAERRADAHGEKSLAEYP